MKRALAGTKPGPGALLLTVAYVLVVAGCGAEVVPVSGRVTLDGKPLADAVVTFQPRAGGDAAKSPTSGSVGHTDQDGRYNLRLIAPDQSGAAVGEHTVTISAAKGGSDKEPAKGQKLSKAWYDGSKKFRAPAGGTSDANFKI